MLFNSLAYLVFLPVVVLVFWLSPRSWRAAVLLIASYIFYMSWKPIYILLILGLTLTNYAFGIAISKSTKYKKHWLAGGLLANLITLAIFKYSYFAWDLANSLLAPLAKSLPPLSFQIILPLGISFFVFEFIHYIVDVYKGGKPVGSLINFALFASFFPTQIAGPIKRYQDFMPQVSANSKFNLALLDEGVGLILFGLFKKVLFADNLAVVTQSGFARPDLLTGIDLWLCVYAFAFQIYFDFSGYTDIARGSACLLGYKVPHNFNLPYLASSISDFWRRWHISLSTWLKDYLFIPLGGSKSTRLATWRNLAITMILGGLWHGAALHFVVWGAYQGIFLILHKEFKRITDSITYLKQCKETSLYKVCAVIVTFHIVCIGWVFFRAENMPVVFTMLEKLFFFYPNELSSTKFAISIINSSDPLVFMLLPFILLLLFLGQLISAYYTKSKHPKIAPALKAAYVAVLISLLMVFSPDTSPKFIYFQF